jgi:hypothetical protein
MSSQLSLCGQTVLLALVSDFFRCLAAVVCYCF